MTLPADTSKRSEEEEGRTDAETMRCAFATVAEELEPLSEAELKRVIRAVLALRGLTWEDLES